MIEQPADWRDTRPRHPAHDPAFRREVLNYLTHLCTRAGVTVPHTIGHALDAAARENA